MDRGAEKSYSRRLMFLLMLCGLLCACSHDASTEQKAEQVMVRVYMHEQDSLVKMPLEDYLVGVVAQEMPAEFATEALKAQAVAARTYTVGRMKKIYGDQSKHPQADICTDFRHCQAYCSQTEFMRQSDVQKSTLRWKKIQQAVAATEGIVLTYKGMLANPLYHANGGGVTEAAKNIWTETEVPYLKSVISLGDDVGENFTVTKAWDAPSFLEKLGISKKSSVAEIIASIRLKTNESGRIQEVNILGKSIKGTDFRQSFGLPSTFFTIEGKGEKLVIITKGNGHGVGMSQWGANYMATHGSNFKEILKHYYAGIELVFLDAGLGFR